MILRKTNHSTAILINLLNSVLKICLLHDSNNPLLHLACQRGNHAMVEILLAQHHFQHEIYRQQPSTKNMPLHEATLRCNAQIVEMLIQKVSRDELFKALTDNKCHNKDELSLFHIACRDNHCDIVKMFFDSIEQNDAKLVILANSMGKTHKSPKHYACQGGDEQVVALLKEHKAVITSNEYDTFPIHVVARY